MNTCDRHPSAIARWLVYFDNGPLFFCNHCFEKGREKIFLKYRYTDLVRERQRRVIPVRNGDA